LDRKLADSIAYLEDKVIDAEKKTLWRINDCEEILRSKVTERYVDDSVRSMEEKLRRDVFDIKLYNSLGRYNLIQRSWTCNLMN
jgi:hypothetical protein